VLSTRRGIVPASMRQRAPLPEDCKPKQLTRFHR
jgi:hypothetical protein